MIKDIYDSIRIILKKTGLRESKVYFDLDNVPDSLTDKSFIISEMVPVSGDYSDPDNKDGFQGSIINVKSAMKIFISKNISMNNVGDDLRYISAMVETIIKKMISIEVGTTLDNVRFVGSNSFQNGVVLVTEIDFDINYRINNLI